MAALQSFNIALEKEGKKKKKKLSQHGVFVVGHPANASTTRSEQGLTLLSGRIMLLSLWYSDYAERCFFSKMRKGIKKRKNL